MSKAMDERLKKMNPTGIEWDDMTEQQKLELREQWDAIVSVPENLDCSCFRTGCRNNRNCRNCMALHRYYDGLSHCMCSIVDAMQADVPLEKRYNQHYKIQASGRAEGVLQSTEDPNISRERLAQQDAPGVMRQRIENWAEIVRKPKNTACTCPKTDCWYHGNCVKCAALHRYYDGFPQCIRYIVDKVDTIIEEHDASQNG